MTTPTLQDPEVIAAHSKVRVRDFIPEGEEMTPAEKARQVVPGMVKKDFVPDEGDEAPAIPRAKREAARAQAHQEAREAQERRKARNSRSLVARVEEATKLLKGRSAQDTVLLIEGKNMEDREVLLLAEEEDRNRVTVLRSFSPVRNVTRDRLAHDRAAPAAAES